MASSTSWWTGGPLYRSLDHRKLRGRHHRDSVASHRRAKDPGARRVTDVTPRMATSCTCSKHPLCGADESKPAGADRTCRSSAGECRCESEHRIRFGRCDQTRNAGVCKTTRVSQDARLVRRGWSYGIVASPWRLRRPPALAYGKSESGRRDVYVRPFAGQSGKWAVSTSGGSRPVWSRAKPQLLYSTDGGIMVVDYTAPGQVFNPGKPQVWLKERVLDFDLAADGRRCVIMQEENPREPGPRQFTFLLNFFDELRRRVNVAR